MSSDLESPLNGFSSSPFVAGSTLDTRNRSATRAHPRLTGYRMLFLILTSGFGAFKAYLSYRGQTTVPTTLDWMYGVVVASGLYWVGLYEEECVGRMPRWLFETDFVEHTQSQMTRALARYRNLNLRLLLRKIFSCSDHQAGDPEQHIQLNDSPPTHMELVGNLGLNVGEATGVQLVPVSTGISYGSGGGYTRHSGTNLNNREGTLLDCQYCDRSFVSEDALHDHCVAKADHPYCESCERIFDNEQALQQHLRDAPVHRASDRLQKDLTYCRSCDKQFVNEQALQQHMQDTSAHHFCKQCDRQFRSLEATYQHLAASSSHEWCFGCCRDFGAYEKLKKHCNSVHARKGKRTACPLCEEYFSDPIDIGPHIERGCT
ncbi:hypothetical protein B0H11DRAFT_2075109 [Mycena galericulata]|nr:hypothetical protein B0H11DRAFT_2075109 [Mycena galericulata]